MVLAMMLSIGFCLGNLLRHRNHKTIKKKASMEQPKDTWAAVVVVWRLGVPAGASETHLAVTSFVEKQGAPPPCLKVAHDGGVSLSGVWRGQHTLRCTLQLQACP